MKRIFTIITVTIFVWGCAKKISPQASSTPMSSNSGSAVATPETTPKLGNSAPVGNTPVAPSPSSTPASPAAVPSVPSTPEGTRTPTDRSGTKSPEMLGQSTFNAKCGKCHGLKVTTDYTADRWISIMQVMATKAQLTEIEKENVLAYVKVNAKR
ncbi:hypothetical protein [Ferruginibacter sp.]